MSLSRLFRIALPQSAPTINYYFLLIATRHLHLPLRKSNTMLTITFLTLTLGVGSVQGINIKSPNHQLLATSCLMDIINSSFPENAEVTLLTEDGAETPGYEVENYLLEYLNREMKWAVQITNGSDNYGFESLEYCVNCDTLPKNMSKEEASKRMVFKYQFQLTIPVEYYVFITDDAEKLRINVWRLKQTKEYRIRAQFLIYYFKIPTDEVKTAIDILKILYDASNFQSVVMLPTVNHTFNLYAIDLYSEEAFYCLKQPEYAKINECADGSFVTKQFTMRYSVVDLNCSIDALGMILPPFVINRKVGLEINILKEFEEKLNISFIYDLSETAEDWGRLENGTWNGLVKNIYDNKYSLGVGSVSQTEDRLKDFDFSDDYFNEKMVWVVPAALPIPQWKVIVVIFNDFLWFILFITFLVFWVLFYIMSKLQPKESNFLKSILGSMTMSMQVMIQIAVHNQPITRAVRSIFISYVLFNVIVMCYYQSSLIDSLTNTRYEKQINSEQEVLKSGLGIGGLAAYRNIFKAPNDPHATYIYNMYEIYAKENDSMDLWVETVAKDRDTITVLGEFYVRYLIAKKDPVITNHDLSPKIHLVPDVLYIDPIRLIYPKGFPLKDTFDHIIRGLVRAGIISKWTNDYLKYLQKEMADDDDDDNSTTIDEEHDHEDMGGVTKLTPMHMQGAFMLLLIGGGAGCFSFIGEILFCLLKKSVWYNDLLIKMDKRKRRKKKVRELRKGRVVKPFVL